MARTLQFDRVHHRDLVGSANRSGESSLAKKYLHPVIERRGTRLTETSKSEVNTNHAFRCRGQAAYFIARPGLYCVMIMTRRITGEAVLMPIDNELELNATATAEHVVGPEDLASALPIGMRDEFPAVLATARMVALMEIAAARVLQRLLGPGELSVGVTVDISHTAPTPPGVVVTATARYEGREGKLFVFEVSASDPGGEIGRGWHKRAIVTSERLQTGAAKRVSSRS